MESKINYFVKVNGSAQNQGVDPFPVPFSHLLAPCRPFCIFEVLIEEIIESITNSLRLDLFLDLVKKFGPLVAIFDFAGGGVFQAVWLCEE